MSTPRHTIQTMHNQDKQYCDYYIDCNGCEFADSKICNTKTCTLLSLHKMQKNIESIDIKVETWKLTV